MRGRGMRSGGERNEGEGDEEWRGGGERDEGGGEIDGRGEGKEWRQESHVDDRERSVMQLWEEDGKLKLRRNLGWVRLTSVRRTSFLFPPAHRTLVARPHPSPLGGRSQCWGGGRS